MIDKEKLTGQQSKYILIPYDIIIEKTVDKRRGLVYSYLYSKTGIDNTLLFNTENLKQYAGKKTGVAHKDDTYTEKILPLLDYMKYQWFLSYDGNIKKRQCKELYFDKDKIHNYCLNNRFAVIYLDELNIILSDRSNNIYDNRFDSSIVLLVFLYLRANIPIRHNEYCDNAEAFNAYYKSIGDDIGLSERTVSKAVSVLVDLGLTYVRERSPVKYYDKKTKEYKFRTPTNIFCNTYKRKKRGADVYLEAKGDGYYSVEVENKIKYLEEHNIL
ncbi:MAG: hypothetical protein IJV31_00950 [Clostridia bacterium]|nr:hypothetical protein [Clostridia bacterium]MBQ9657318.1 hypothetical protein [Clostridia bacterium]